MDTNASIFMLFLFFDMVPSIASFPKERRTMEHGILYKRSEV